MVDALYEVRRTLASEGTLVDLRPVSGHCAIDVVTPGATLHVGEVDATGMADDDDKANRAIAKAVERRWFVPRRHRLFDFDFYWDTADEMASFMDGSRRMKQVDPPYSQLEKIRLELSGRASSSARFRCRRRTMLSVYSKAPPPCDPP